MRGNKQLQASASSFQRERGTVPLGSHAAASKACCISRSRSSTSCGTATRGRPHDLSQLNTNRGKGERWPHVEARHGRPRGLGGAGWSALVVAA
jgi:hypothetical protein